MPKNKAAAPTQLKGWKDIANYLGQPVATAQHWAKSGMPVTRSGRFVYATPDHLNRWLGSESGAPEPVHIATEDADLAAELRQGLLQARRSRHKRAA